MPYLPSTEKKRHNSQVITLQLVNIAYNIHRGYNIHTRIFTVWNLGYLVYTHWRIQRPVFWGGQKFWRVKPNLPPFSTFSSDFGHFIFKTQNFNNFYFMFNFYINFCQIPQALRSELAYLAEGPSLAIKRHSLTSRRLFNTRTGGGGAKKCPHLRFFADSGKTAARSAAIFSGPA